MTRYISVLVVSVLLGTVIITAQGIQSMGTFSHEPTKTLVEATSPQQFVEMVRDHMKICHPDTVWMSDLGANPGNPITVPAVYSPKWPSQILRKQADDLQKCEESSLAMQKFVR